MGARLFSSQLPFSFFFRAFDGQNPADSERQQHPMMGVLAIGTAFAFWVV